jgi:cell division protein FtsB
VQRLLAENASLKDKLDKLRSELEQPPPDSQAREHAYAQGQGKGSERLPGVAKV